METTFYDDNASRYGRSAPLKRPSTLDLGGGGAKRAARGNALLTSPDLHMLKLESPELEKLIIQQHGVAQQQQQPCLYQKDEHYHHQRDFPDALAGLPATSEAAYTLYQPQVDGTYGYHHQQQQPPPVSCYAPPLSGGYYGGAPAEPLVSVKEEPQTVPSCASSPPPSRSPIDMADQERLKLERKRLRNRIAASKCRRRKLERIARLEDKVAHLKGENAELTGHVTRLKEHVCRLKQQVMEHVRAGCEILVAAPCQPQHYDPDL